MDTPERRSESAQPPDRPARDAPRVLVSTRSEGPGIIVRALWFVFIGWWLTAVVNVVGYLIGLTIIGLPVAFLIFNRLPSVLTLRPRTVHTTHQVASGIAYVTESTVAQRTFLGRTAYFIVIGWWFGALWSGLAWLLCVLILTLPLGVMMYNRLPAVMTLRRY